MLFCIDGEIDWPELVIHEQSSKNSIIMSYRYIHAYLSTVKNFVRSAKYMNSLLLRETRSNREFCLFVISSYSKLYTLKVY